MRWKGRLQKASPEFIIDMLQRIPEECIRQTTEAWRDLQIEEAKKSEAVDKRFLISRDAHIKAKTQAVKSFLSWCREKHGTLKPKHLYHLERGQIPHGWFSEYVKAHPQLRKASNVLDRIGKVNRRSYVRVLKLYGHAIQLVLSKTPRWRSSQPPRWRSSKHPRLRRMPMSVVLPSSEMEFQGWGNSISAAR